ncbi:MAG: DUF58 domain-containing protein [Verrucomicrobiota bacterium]
MTEKGGFAYLPSGFQERLKNVEIRVRKPIVGDRQNQHRSKTFGSSVEFAQYREYMEGDPLQRIDWNVYARSDKYVIRQSFEEVNAKTYVLLDISASMNWQGSGKMTKLDYGRYLAAGMLFTMVKQGDSAGLVTFDRKIRHFDQPVSSAMGIRPMLEHLENIEAGEPGDVEAVLHETAELARGKVLIILISDLLQDAESIIRGLHHLRHGGKEITIFHVLDPMEISLHGVKGLAELTELESKKDIVVDMDAIRESYQRKVQQHLSDLKRRCLDMGLDYELGDTNTDPFSLIRKRGQV